jgi:hypothetical protein
MDISLPAGHPGTRPAQRLRDIFNRIAARDLGIRDNYKVADAPVRYPFLWNASRQDRTQWNGGIHNGLYIQALGRNTGEVLGVFADFTPHRVVVPTPLMPAIIDFKNNSINFAWLQKKKKKIAVLRPPPWPREISDSTSGWRRPANPCLTPIAAAATRCRLRSTLPTFGAPHPWRFSDPKMLINSQRTSQPGLLVGA